MLTATEADFHCAIRNRGILYVAFHNEIIFPQHTLDCLFWCIMPVRLHEISVHICIVFFKGLSIYITITKLGEILFTLSIGISDSVPISIIYTLSIRLRQIYKKGMSLLLKVMQNYTSFGMGTPIL